MWTSVVSVLRVFWAWVSSSPSPLCCPRRWALPRSAAMDSLRTQVLFARQSTRSRLSRKVPRCARTSFSQAQAHSRGTTNPSAIAACVCGSTPHGCSAQVGRICQATLCRSFASFGLSLSLYASNRHLQLSLAFYGRRQGHLSLARLCPWIPKSDHDPGGR